jgi:putative endonuclease
MTKEIGKDAEEAAASYLKSRGYRILHKNLSFIYGELDLVALDGETVVFVEVKYRKNLDHGFPFEAVTKSKQKKIIMAANTYLAKYASLPACRFDVVSMHGELSKPTIDHIIDAFWAE